MAKRKARKSAVAEAGVKRAPHDASEVAGIFAALKKTQHATHATATTATTSVGASATQAAHDDGTTPRRRDGLYHAPEKSVTMSDDEFFAGTAATGARSRHLARPQRNSSSSGDDKAIASAAGVDRIVSMKQLRRMLSSSSRAGTTPHCPFDCDCCF